MDFSSSKINDSAMTLTLIMYDNVFFFFFFFFFFYYYYYYFYFFFSFLDGDVPQRASRGLNTFC